MGLTPTALLEPADARAATDVVKQLIDDGVDGIKLFLSAPNGSVLDRAVVDAAVAEAHRAKKPVFAHPNTSADVATALSAGVDVLAHTTPRSPWGRPLATSVSLHTCLLANLKSSRGLLGSLSRSILVAPMAGASHSVAARPESNCWLSYRQRVTNQAFGKSGQLRCESLAGALAKRFHRAGKYAENRWK
jgi:hypothetical protein